MDISEVGDLFFLAYDDYTRAVRLSLFPYRMDTNGISYHCAQAMEKFLKGYIAYNNQQYTYTHNLLDLLDDCIKLGKHPEFETLRTNCRLLNKFSGAVRYTRSVDAAKEDASYFIHTVEKLMAFPAISRIKDDINKSVHQEEILSFEVITGNKPSEYNAIENSALVKNVDLLAKTNPDEFWKVFSGIANNNPAVIEAAKKASPLLNVTPSKKRHPLLTPV